MAQNEDAAVWYIQTKQSTSGPFTAVELAQKFRSKELSGDTRVKSSVLASESTSLEEFVASPAAYGRDAIEGGDAFSPPPRPDLPSDGPTHSMIVAGDPRAADPAVGLFDALQAARDKAADQKKRRDERGDSFSGTSTAPPAGADVDDSSMSRSLWMIAGVVLVVGGLSWAIRTALNQTRTRPSAATGSVANSVNPPLVPTGSSAPGAPLPPAAINPRAAAQNAPLIPGGAPLSPIRPNFSNMRGAGGPNAANANAAEDEARRRREREDEERRREEERRRDEEDRRRMDELRDRMDREGGREGSEPRTNPNDAGTPDDRDAERNRDDSASEAPRD